MSHWNVQLDCGPEQLGYSWDEDAGKNQELGETSTEERTKLIAKFLIDSLVDPGDVPTDLRPALLRTAAELSSATLPDPHEFAAAVLRRYGYRAEPKECGLVWRFRAERLGQELSSR